MRNAVVPGWPAHGQWRCAATLLREPVGCLLLRCGALALPLLHLLLLLLLLHLLLHLLLPAAAALTQRLLLY
jgi:hypothetical protein